ncbi:GNAT family acetyltransferase [Limibacillus halophilus]|uniref:GNAT superfamily N-acetyltransferase n=1 Tax=Limibacillus halophilus TaxID=1579333 RepID=A0A839SSR5_9PROT|nr:GNAT family acetyltransferase [Limibacillus halophilus]MBB3065512.1 GNAT superfamily N-acetyltransferase [Limibacillus halophilus]
MGQSEKKSLKIRRYRDTDFDALVALWKNLGMLAWYNDPTRDIGMWQASKDAQILIGEVDGALAASVCVGHDGHRGWFYYLAVAEDHQRKGFGRLLVDASEAWLKARKVAKVQLMIRPGNHKAHSFYEAIGYEINPCSLRQKWLIDRGEPPADANLRDRIEVTITYLEMTERKVASLQTPHLTGHRLGLLRAERPTLSFYRFLYNTVGRDWLWYERRRMSDDALRDIIENDLVEVFVLYAEGVPAGFFELDARKPGTVDLALLGVMPEFIGRRFGPFLLHSAVDRAWEKQPDKVTVNTCTLDHPKALPLYQKVGFVPVSRKTIQIDDPRENGLIPY